MGIRSRIAQALFGDVIDGRVQAAVKVIDDKWWAQIAGAVGPHDVQWHEKQAQLSDALEAWRTNPMANRIVSLMTDYVVGSGVRLLSGVPWVQDFIDSMWEHRRNRLDMRVYRWCDELTRSGELFLVLSTNTVDGLSYIREVPASRIDKVETDPNDYELELRYHEMRSPTGQNKEEVGLEGRWWTAAEAPGAVAVKQVMVHYAINRPIGCVRGQGDLASILEWLSHYKSWVEDRVRANKYKNAFLWQVTLKNATRDQIAAKRSQYARPPSPGSILITDENEEWVTVQPELQGWDAASDGHAIRLMVAVGAGVPLHFLSEGESATKATAAEMGDPTFRHYIHRQLFFCEMLMDMVRVCVGRARAVGRGWGWQDLKLSYEVQDLTKDDNEKLANAGKTIVEALAVMKEQGWVDDETAMRIAYRFAGELVDVNEMMRRMGTMDPKGAATGPGPGSVEESEGEDGSEGV